MSSTDWKFIHQKRKALNKRLLAEIERKKADAFVQHLKRTETNYTAWLNEQIDKELEQS